jgi:molybdopterin/thiamine biosynthesis adenylyltransferase
VQKLSILDSDNLHLGNLVRHSLTMEDIGFPKSLRLAARLNKISPHATAFGINDEFPPADALTKEKIEQCDVIIDCTGSDEVVRRLDIYSWAADKIFFSIAIGFDALRIFCFAQNGRFSSSEFFKQLRPWLELERTENRGRELPREGIGCWNPVFPARADDVWLLVSSIVGVVDSLDVLDTSNPGLTVFERIQSEGHTIGVKKNSTIGSETK